MTVPVITIDGPSGSGKGTIALRLAKALGWHFLDSGALYRVLGLAAIRAGVDPQDEEAVTALLPALNLSFGASGAVLDGVNVEGEIRTEQAGNNASKVAAHPRVRGALLQWQRDFAKPPGLVADGRDMGTVVFPAAPLKIFLTASAERRAERRHKQLKEKGIDANFAALAAEIRERDERDRGRTVAPLSPAGDAMVIDSSDLGIDEVMRKVWSLVEERLPEDVR